jgi:hypothetical protein
MIDKASEVNAEAERGPATPTAGGRPQRRRGKGFPGLPLDESADVIKNAGKYGREHSVAAFAGYLGHDSTNSGAFLAKMAALNDWGLIDRSGGRVAVSVLGERVAYPVSDHDEEEALREAFLNAALFARVYEDSTKQTDLSLEVIGNRAVTGLGVAATRKNQFAQSFARSAVAAGLGRMSNGSLQLLTTERTPAAGAEAAETQEADGDGAGRTRQKDADQPSDAPPTLHQEWRVKAGTLVFEARLAEAFPAAAFRDLASVTEAIEKLTRSLGGSAEASDTRDTSRTETDRR